MASLTLPEFAPTRRSKTNDLYAFSLVPSCFVRTQMHAVYPEPEN